MSEEGGRWIEGGVVTHTGTYSITMKIDSVDCVVKYKFKNRSGKLQSERDKER
jgi:hypothetical protein